MSAAIAQIDASLARVHARLTMLHWISEDRKASLACVAAMGRGERIESRAHEVWAEICALRAQVWREEVTK